MPWLDYLPWRRQKATSDGGTASTDPDYENYDLLDTADFTSAEHRGVDKKMLAAVNMTGAFGRERHLERLQERIAQVTIVIPNEVRDLLRGRCQSRCLALLGMTIEKV